jgi:hypothetical protein
MLRRTSEYKSWHCEVIRKQSLEGWGFSDLYVLFENLRLYDGCTVDRVVQQGVKRTVHSLYNPVRAK